MHADGQHQEPDELRIRQIHREQYELEKAGRWNMAEYERLRHEMVKAAGDDGQAIVDFELYEPDA